MQKRRYGWALGLALGMASGAAAQGIFGLEAGPEDGALAVPATPDAPEVVPGLRTPGFDPVRDVPAMRNWKGDMQLDGAGNCYAISSLTAYFHSKVEFVADDEGVAWDQWDRDFSKVLKVDEKSLEELPHLLARSLDDVREHGKVKLGGYEGLNEFTAVEPLTAAQQAEVDALEGVAAERKQFEYSDRQESTRAFRRWAEAAQYFMQLSADGDNYAGSLLKSGLGWVPFIDFGPDAVNRDGLNIIRDRLREGRAVPISMHPSGLKAEGHVVVVYQLVENDDEAILTTYDCNRPPVDGAARPTTVTISKHGDWNYVAERADGGTYDGWSLITVPGLEGRGDRRRLERTAGNDQEQRERMSHLGRVVSSDSSLGDRIKGGLGFVGEVLNPF